MLKVRLHNMGMHPQKGWARAGLPVLMCLETWQILAFEPRKNIPKRKPAQGPHTATQSPPVLEPTLMYSPAVLATPSPPPLESCSRTTTGQRSVQPQVELAQLQGCSD